MRPGIISSMKTFVLAVIWALSLAVAGAATTKPSTPAGKPEEKQPVIEGYEIARKSSGYLGLEVVGGNFQLSFYDEKKRPVPADVARATARWNPPQKTGSAFAVLNPSGDGKTLTGNKFVRPPLNFIVFINLLNAAGEATESYTVNLMK